MSNFLQVTPFLQVQDLEHALAFFTGILGSNAFALPSMPIGIARP